MKCVKILVHQQPYKEILWSLNLDKTLLFEVIFFFMISLWLDLSLWLSLWKLSCLITLKIWSLVLNLVLLSSKSRLTKPWFHSFLYLFEVETVDHLLLYSAKVRVLWNMFFFPFWCVLGFHLCSEGNSS